VGDDLSDVADQLIARHKGHGRRTEGHSLS
jgi:hypothetical protein